LTRTGYAILGISLIMFLYGMVMIFSASSGLALHAYGSSYYFLLRQAIWFAVGLVALAALAYTDYHRVAEFSPVLMALSLAALVAVPFFGTEAYGSKRSIIVGPIVVQPSEIAKMALLVFAVYIYSKREDKLDSWREVIMPVLVVTALSCLLIILEPDLGSMLVVAISVYAVLWLAGTPLRKMALLALVGGSATLLFIFTSGYRKARFLAFLDPWSAPREGGFHIIQSMIALGSGNVSGLGLGMSRQKFFYLPNAHTDFIFSIIGEEAGLVGTLSVLALFALFVYLGFRIAKGAPDRLGRLLAMGITCMLGAQALINMGAASGVLPITGITLPFFSYGGSSLVICMCLAGILINVSRQEGGASASYNGRNKLERGDMRRRNRRPSPPPARPGRGTRIA
jgi:cell division protein FtsW